MIKVENYWQKPIHVYLLDACLCSSNWPIGYAHQVRHCWLEDVWNYKNKWPQNNYIFLIPLNIPDFAASIVFLIRVRLPGGAAIIFAQSWNFELKFMQKINSTGIGSHSLPKKFSKEPKTWNQKLYQCLEKDWKWP